MANNNIFEGAEFGDRFLTRDGRTAIYACNSYSNEQQTLHFMILFDKIVDIRYDYNGIIRDSDNHKLDILSRYQEPIDEDKLDELAEETMDNMTTLCQFDKNYNKGNRCIFKSGFKSGYRKAKE